MSIDVRTAPASGSVSLVAEHFSYTNLLTESLGDGVFVYSGLYVGRPVTVIQAPAAMVLAVSQA